MYNPRIRLHLKLLKVESEYITYTPLNMGVLTPQVVNKFGNLNILKLMTKKTRILKISGGISREAVNGECYGGGGSIVE